ncbi:unnamed protein product [Blepharisma stoltei]|uniref:Uncharacterized protein n=1 Tax=Blepharisma stoltei TaxID=1481888 RepID=A0AAU9K5J1_9CILI|nr:unnamed protein product [Blepharisma stoltei]
MEINMIGPNNFFSQPIFNQKSETSKLKKRTNGRNSSQLVTMANPSMTLASYKYKAKSLKGEKKPSICLTKIPIKLSKSAANSARPPHRMRYVPKSSCIAKINENGSENSFESTNSCIYKTQSSFARYPDKNASETSSLSDDKFSSFSISNLNIENKISLTSLSIISLKEEISSAKELFKAEIECIKEDIKKIKAEFINKSFEDESEIKNSYIKKIKKNDKKIEMLEYENKLLKAKLKQKDLLYVRELRCKI